MKPRAAISSAIALCSLLAAAAPAQEVPPNIITATVREGWRTDRGTQMAALELALAPGWKTYWRAPGEAGFPPQFDWSGSDNVGAVALHWPRPEVFDLNGIRTFGYRDRLVLPIEFRPLDPARPIALSARIDLGVCDVVCVPITLDLAADLAPGGRPDPVIRAALAEMPEPGAQAGLTAARCEVAPIRDGMRVTSYLTLPPMGPDEVAVIEFADQTVWVSPADTARAGDVLSATADLVPAKAKPFALDRSALRITVFGAAGRAVEVQGCTG